MRFAKSLGLLAVLVLLPLGGPAPANAITYFWGTGPFDPTGTDYILMEDFESVFPKDTALPSFTSNGITYTGTQASSPNVWVASPGYPNFDVPVTTSSVLTANGPEDFRLDLSTPAKAMVFDVYHNGIDNVTLSFYDQDGDFLASMGNNATGLGFMGVLLDTGGSISGVTFHSVGGERINTGIDNVRMIPAPIPAPGAALLGMIGATLVGWFRRWIP